MLILEHCSSLRTLTTKKETPRSRGREAPAAEEALVSEPSRRDTQGWERGSCHCARSPRPHPTPSPRAQLQTLRLSAHQERGPAPPCCPAPRLPPAPSSAPRGARARSSPRRSAPSVRAVRLPSSTWNDGSLCVPGNPLTFDMQDTGCPLTLGSLGRSSERAMPGPPAPRSATLQTLPTAIVACGAACLLPEAPGSAATCQRAPPLPDAAGSSDRGVQRGLHVPPRPARSIPALRPAARAAPRGASLASSPPRPARPARLRARQRGRHSCEWPVAGCRDRQRLRLRPPPCLLPLEGHLCPPGLEKCVSRPGPSLTHILEPQLRSREAAPRTFRAVAAARFSREFACAPPARRAGLSRR